MYTVTRIVGVVARSCSPPRGEQAHCNSREDDRAGQEGTHLRESLGGIRLRQRNKEVEPEQNAARHKSKQAEHAHPALVVSAQERNHDRLIATTSWTRDGVQLVHQ